MVKIDLESAYDSFTQKSLFMDISEENLSPESDFTPKQIEDAKKENWLMDRYNTNDRRFAVFL